MNQDDFFILFKREWELNSSMSYFFLSLVLYLYIYLFVYLCTYSFINSFIKFIYSFVHSLINSFVYLLRFNLFQRVAVSFTEPTYRRAMHIIKKKLLKYIAKQRKYIMNTITNMI